jgi:R5 protein
VKVKENVLVAKASTKKYTDREDTTYTATNEKYSVEKEKEFTIDGVKFVFNKLVPVSSKYNNTTEENGVIKEGTTTVVYEYKPVLPSNDIVNEKPEFNGGVNPINPPVVDVPEYKEPIGGAIVPPEVHEKPEFKGGVSPIDPPVVEKPEAEVPKVETPKAEEPKKEEEPKEVIKKKEELPVTSSSSMLGMFGLVGAFGMRKKRKKDK